MEHRQPAFDAPAAKVQGLSDSAPLEIASVPASKKQASRASHDPGTPALVTRLALSGASVASGAGWTGAAAPQDEAARLESVESEPQSGEEAPAGVEVPPAPKPPLVVPDSDSREGEEPPPEEQKPEDGEDGKTDEPASQDPPAGEGEEPAQEETKQEEPSSTPATDGPMPPISS